MTDRPVEEEAGPEDRIPSVVLVDPFDTEDTKLTRIARRAVWTAIEDVVNPEIPERENDVRFTPVQFVEAHGATFIVEIRGQSSYTGHGKQGLRPERLALLYHLQATTGIPVILVFVEGAESWRWAWLSALGPTQPIAQGDGTAGSRRSGWPVRDPAFTKESGRITLFDAPLPAPPGPTGLF